MNPGDKWIGPIKGTEREDLELMDTEYMFAIERAMFRMENATRNRFQDYRASANETDFEIHKLGALCEVAAWKAIGGWLWRNQDGVTDAGYDIKLDGGIRIEVKGGRPREPKYLVVPQHGDISKCDYLLGVTKTDYGAFRLDGFISRAAFMHRREWLAWLPRPAWGVLSDTLIRLPRFRENNRQASYEEGERAFAKMQKDLFPE